MFKRVVLYAEKAIPKKTGHPVTVHFTVVSRLAVRDAVPARDQRPLKENLSQMARK